MDPHTAIDILAGARYWHEDMSINLALAGTLDTGDLSISGNRAIARSGSVDWVDPLVGGRIRYNLAPGQDFILRGDVGGFGVGSQFTWNALAAYSFVFSKRDGVTYSGLLGYRALSADYEQGSGRTKYVYDVVMHGPVTGLTIGFDLDLGLGSSTTATAPATNAHASQMRGAPRANSLLERKAFFASTFC